MTSGLNRDLGFQTNVAIRARIRELAERPAMDDYDRSVLMLLDDFARCMVLIAALSDANRRSAPITNAMVEAAAAKFMAHQHGVDILGYPEGTYRSGIMHSAREALNAALQVQS